MSKGDSRRPAQVSAAHVRAEMDRIFAITGHCDECGKPLKGKGNVIDAHAPASGPPKPPHRGTPKKVKRSMHVCNDCLRWWG